MIEWRYALIIQPWVANTTLSLLLSDTNSYKSFSSWWFIEVDNITLKLDDLLTSKGNLIFSTLLWYTRTT